MLKTYQEEEQHMCIIPSGFTRRREEQHKLLAQIHGNLDPNKTKRVVIMMLHQY